MRSRNLAAFLGTAVVLAGCSVGASPTPQDLLGLLTANGTVRCRRTLSTRRNPS